MPTLHHALLVLGLGLGEVSAVLVRAAVLVGEGLGRVVTLLLLLLRLLVLVPQKVPSEGS